MDLDQRHRSGTRVARQSSLSGWRGNPGREPGALDPGDETPEKLPFYASLGVREVLIIDPDGGRLELLRLVGGAFRAVAGGLRSEVTGLEYAVVGDGIEIRQPESGRTWVL